MFSQTGRARQRFSVDAVAQLDLGIMYDNGRGALQDYAEAVRWFRLAAAPHTISCPSISLSMTPVR